MTPNFQTSSIPTFPFAKGPYGAATIAYDELQASKPVCRVLAPSGLEVWLVTRYADVCAVLKNPTFSRDQAVRVGATLVESGGIELVEGVLQNTDGEQHSRLRSLFGRYYSPAQVTRWMDIIRDEVRAAIDHTRPGEEFDLRADFFEPVARRSAETIFGFPAWGDTEILQVFFDEQLISSLRQRIVSMLECGAQGAASPYLAELATASQRGLISERDLIDNLIVFMTATFDAVRAPFLGGLFALLRDPIQWEMCRRERPILPNAINEMLRCYSNGDGQFLRVATEDSRIDGVPIKRGDAVLASTAAANVDPARFPDPRRFDVRRSNSSEHVGFGVGPHRCIGAHLAGAWMRTALEALLDRMPSLRLAVAPAAITYRPIPLINIMDGLPAIY
jgi:cytochrome P450